MKLKFYLYVDNFARPENGLSTLCIIPFAEQAF